MKIGILGCGFNCDERIDSVLQSWIDLKYDNNFIFSSCDNLSIILILLTTFLTFICLTISLQINNFKVYSFCFFIMQLFLIIVWSIFDIFIFYLFFESVLIPMFIIIKLDFCLDIVFNF